MKKITYNITNMGNKNGTPPKNCARNLY